MHWHEVCEELRSLRGCWNDVPRARSEKRARETPCQLSQIQTPGLATRSVLPYRTSQSPSFLKSKSMSTPFSSSIQKLDIISKQAKPMHVSFSIFSRHACVVRRAKAVMSDVDGA